MNEAKMKKAILLTAAVCGVALNVSAAYMVETQTITAIPNPSNLDNLDHYFYYTWGFSDVSKAIPEGYEITDAVLTFDNINNWDNNANWLHLYLLDTAENPNNYSEVKEWSNKKRRYVVTGTTPIIDEAPLMDGGKVTSYKDSDIIDSLAGLGWTAKTKIAMYIDEEGSPGPAEYVSYSLADLGFVNEFKNYISNGDNFGLGFDPDCHYWNDGVKFEIICTKTPTSVPEAGASLLLLTLGLGALPVCKRFLRA